jgi:RHS repeat-associated protein
MQFLDLEGDGRPDLADFSALTPGFFEHEENGEWASHRAFTSLPQINWGDPNLKFVDLTGDGHADILISEESVFTWYPSLAEEGFDEGEKTYQPLDDEHGPRLVFADELQTIFLADLSGDGLTDIARIRNGEVCYWPNLGYGRFGSKITMDGAPLFDRPDQFDQRRIRLADIDGSGTTDIIYLHGDGVRIYFNRSGNSWSEANHLEVFPKTDNLASAAAVDLLGNGTACLVWSSPLPADAKRSMLYVDLMGGRKPHLMISARNNLGAETVLHYAPSTKFYLEDKYNGKPWLTKLPFPVQVVERVETFDRISGNHFVSRFAYHHGYFDGPEREFRGFGMVEQWDTDEFHKPQVPASNEDERFAVPTVYTKTWFHTGAFIAGEGISRHLAHEYFGAPQDSAAFDVWARDNLLDDTVLPEILASADEQGQACRVLKGAMLRQEVYALDKSDRAALPYTVLEQSFTIQRAQPQAGNRYAIFFTHPREAISYHYERNLNDPRISHSMTLEVDKFGNVLKQASIGYGRKQPDLALPLAGDRAQQETTLITYTENRFTTAVDTPDEHRNPLSCEVHTFELTGYVPSGAAGRYQASDFVEPDPNVLGRLRHVFLGEVPYEEVAAGPKRRRTVELVRTLYRKNDLTALSPLGTHESLALPGEDYRLAFTPGVLSRVYQRPRGGQPDEALIPDPNELLGSEAGGYLQTQTLKLDGLFPNTDQDGHWWIPSGRTFYSPNTGDVPVAERDEARQHFFLVRRFRDGFGNDGTVRYDNHDLLMVQTRDAVGNLVTVGERRQDGTIDPAKPGNDYRVLQPTLITDTNRNRQQVAFDALGMIVGTAMMGKAEENAGDLLDGFVAELDEAVMLDHLANPLADPNAILGRATTRLVYDLFAYHRTKHLPNPQPAVVYDLVRETHHFDLPVNTISRIQHSFLYSDGFGRQIQKKIQAERETINNAPGPPRWVGSGWTIYNNKGKPVRQFEPFFSATHRFEFGVTAGVSRTLFYDPLERVIAILHPNDTYEKVIFDPWRQSNWDVNDTVANDPPADVDIRGFVEDYFAALPAAPPWATWRARRQGGALGVQEQAAASKANEHRDTPTTIYLDTLARPFLTITDNGPDPAQPAQHLLFANRVERDIEGNERVVRDAIEQAGDARGRIVMRYDYDLLGNRIRQLSMEAGARWMLNDAAGRPFRAWDSRGHQFLTEYDPAHRPVRAFVTGIDPADPARQLLVERLVYGEQHPQGETHNLRGQAYLHLDQSGELVTERNDFKGNPLTKERRLTNETQYRQAVDWRAVEAALPVDAAATFDLDALEDLLGPRLEVDTYTSHTTYDALSRRVTTTTPHKPAMRPNVIRHTYNEGNMLGSVDVNLREEVENGAPVWTPFITNLDYNEKGQRTRLDFGNRVTTTYEYDLFTFRLVQLSTQRDPAVFDDCPQPPPAGFPGCQVQNLHYTFDPAGNITHIRDDAQQAVFFRNKRVEPSCDYTYDATYRLIEAKGREHLGQIGGAPIPHSNDDAPRVRIDWAANDGNALGTYTESYLYDAAGNFMEMQHRGNDPVNPGWTRRYFYEATSLIENGAAGTLLKTSNRLSHTTVGDNNPPLERYVHDAHGNITRMPHLGGVHPAPNMIWDHRDQLQQTDLGGGGRVFYVYDAQGQRIRKVWEKPGGLIEERLYLGGFEIYRRRQGNDRLERETLHVMDDEQLVALVETRILDTANNDPASQQLIRYQCGNHLGSAILELDHQGQIISYEEYTPYGSTAYQAVRLLTETPKRYRYSNKERDEETGFYYYGKRHFVPWLGRWASPDPIGVGGGNNLYSFVLGNPIKFHDRIGLQASSPAKANEIKAGNQAELEQSVKILREQSKSVRIFNDPDPGFETTKLGEGDLDKKSADPAFTRELKQSAAHSCLLNAVRFVVQKRNNVLLGAEGEGDQVMYSLIEKRYVDDKTFDNRFAAESVTPRNYDLSTGKRWLDSVGIESNDPKLVTSLSSLFDTKGKTVLKGEILLYGHSSGADHTYVIHEGRVKNGKIEVRVYDPWIGKNVQVSGAGGKLTEWIDTEDVQIQLAIEFDEKGQKDTAGGHFNVLEVPPRQESSKTQLPSQSEGPFRYDRSRVGLPPY